MVLINALEVTVGVDISVALSSDENHKYKFTQSAENFPEGLIVLYVMKHNL